MMSARANTFADVLRLLARLEAAHLSSQIGSVRPDALMVAVAVPGERWEIEFMLDGSIEVEVFRSDGTIGGSEQLERLFERHE